MTRLTLELSPELARALEARAINEEQAKQIALAALEITTQQGLNAPPTAPSSEAVAFARRLIEQNRALFEELARR